MNKLSCDKRHHGILKNRSDHQKSHNNVFTSQTQIFSIVYVLYSIGATSVGEHHGEEESVNWTNVFTVVFYLFECLLCAFVGAKRAR